MDCVGIGSRLFDGMFFFSGCLIWQQKCCSSHGFRCFLGWLLSGVIGCEVVRLEQDWHRVGRVQYKLRVIFPQQTTTQRWFHNSVRDMSTGDSTLPKTNPLQ